ncbi:MAG: hypothetical protein AB1439_11810 [candidate division FCPU426 bacterium]
MPEQLWEGASYLVAIGGSLLLWINYALVGLIAHRYSQVFHRATYSTLLILAPTGLLVYTLFLIFKATPLLSDPKLASFAQLLAYIALLASGFFCLLGVGRFASVLQSVLRSAQPKEVA